jgi:hypothetical protein
MRRAEVWLLSITVIVVLIAGANVQISRVSGDYAASLLAEVCAASFMLGCIVCLACTGTVTGMGWGVLVVAGLLAIVALGDGISRVLR